MEKRIQKIIIPGRLPGLNEFFSLVHSAENNRHREKTSVDIMNMLKQGEGKKVEWAIKAAGVQPLRQKCGVVIFWFEKDRRRDQDNILSAKKIIMDALKKSKVLGDDGWKYVGNGWADDVFVDKNNPRIEVFLLEGYKVGIDYDSINGLVANVPRGQFS